MSSSAGLQNIPDLLVQEIAIQDAQPVHPEFQIFVDTLKQRFGKALDAVILYGSSLQASDLTEGIADFYVLVSDYQSAYSDCLLACLNAWLPPNVFYLEIPAVTGVMRSKYAVISTADFERGAQWFHPYIWARFAQPARLLYVRDDQAGKRIHIAQAGAVLKFISSTLPMLKPGPGNPEMIWASGLMLTYAAELRAEREARARYLAGLNPGIYNRLTAAALPALGSLLSLQADGQYHINSISPYQRLRARIHWWLRRWQGRVLSILRLSKATMTFRDCLDYAAWKIARHTGIKVEITPMLRRHPILWGYKVMWQLLRRGVLR
ncbi:hypothetical protein [Nitrosomonas sp.]|uniref:hypothetical protein n=1 Tax=Nitrosomonas sp. TaxID=42353 RepID=UPI0025FD0A0C|nr:hypothetical protein [Nitrosomonas sp.]MCC6916237.1 hypothetical protein [Nitrosomonas sp.]